MGLRKYATRESHAGRFPQGRFALRSPVLRLFSVAPAQVLAQSSEPSLWDKMLNTVGVGGNLAPQPAAAWVQAPQASRTSGQAAQPQPQPVPTPQAAQAVQAPAQSPGMFDNILGKVGWGAKPDPSSIDYSERQKLAVPPQRDLPPPQPLPNSR